MSTDKERYLKRSTHRLSQLDEKTFHNGGESNTTQ